MSKIQSIRESIGISYDRPDPNKVQRFIEELHKSEEALDYLYTERGLTQDTLKHFNIGYSPEYHAISIPIYKMGELINIKYRKLGGKPKYLGESNAESWLFNEGGVDVAKKKGAILIVEGEIDAMTVWQNGIKNVVAPSSGKDSYGIWLEPIDNIKNIYIGYDNDSGGKESAQKMAERLGNERCFEVVYTEAKDPNEYFKSHDIKDFRSLLKEAKPFYSHQFKNLGDIIKSLRDNASDIITSNFLPNIQMERGWMVVVSGISNVGKTSYTLNIANDLVSRGIATLVLPFERGIDVVGKRFLNVRHAQSQLDFSYYKDSDWNALIHDSIDLPLYFAMPNKKTTIETIEKSKRYFNTDVVIIDHIDYMIRQVGGNKGDAISDTLQEMKRVAEDNGIVLIIVSHLRKIENSGVVERSRKPHIEDLKGSSSLYQDPEAVVMLSKQEEYVLVDVVKNKGEQISKLFSFQAPTGRFLDDVGDMPPVGEELEKIWNGE